MIRSEGDACCQEDFSPRDVGLVNWRVNDEGLNDDKTISSAPFDSDLRNRFDPQFNTFLDSTHKCNSSGVFDYVRGARRCDLRLEVRASH